MNWVQTGGSWGTPGEECPVRMTRAKVVCRLGGSWSLHTEGILAASGFNVGASWGILRLFHKLINLSVQLMLKWKQAGVSWGSMCWGHPGRIAEAEVGTSQGVPRHSMQGEPESPSGVARAEVICRPGGPCSLIRVPYLENWSWNKSQLKCPRALHTKGTLVG